MKFLAYILFLGWLHSLAKVATDALPNPTKGSSILSSFSRPRFYKSSIERFIDKSFHERDINGDGMISFEEAYVGCLLLYVRLNQQAPIPPPSREKFLRIFVKAANKHSNNGNKGSTSSTLLDKDEYRFIMRTIVERAFFRLTSYKVVTLAGAPLLAEMIVRSLAHRKGSLESFLRSVIPVDYHETWIPTLTSKAFHRGLWMVILVTTLGNVVLGGVTRLLDMSLPSTNMIRRQLKTFNMA